MAEGTPADEPDLTRDAFFGGRLTIAQPVRGHRSGTDAVLLAAAVPRDCAGLVYDIGAGVGVAGLGVALGCPAAHVELVDNDGKALRLSSANVAINDLIGRVKVVGCDVLSRADREAAFSRKADVIITNPPFHDAARVRLSPDPGRRAAHTMQSGDLADWLAACLDLLVAKGRLIVIHHVAAVPELMASLAQRAGDIALLAVHPRKGEPARRVLVRAIKGSRAPMTIAAPLVLHEGDAFTAEAEALNRGEVGLSW